VVSICASQKRQPESTWKVLSLLRLARILGWPQGDGEDCRCIWVGEVQDALVQRWANSCCGPPSNYCICTDLEELIALGFDSVGLQQRLGFNNAGLRQRLVSTTASAATSPAGAWLHDPAILSGPTLAAPKDSP
jgi:hypothetical protein